MLGFKRRMTLRVLVATISIVTLPPSIAQAQYQLDTKNQFYGDWPDLATLSATMQGYPVTLVALSGATFEEMQFSQYAKFSVNDVIVEFSTTGESIYDNNNATDTFTIKVDGETVYSGTLDNLSVQDEFDFYEALGLAGAGEQAAIEQSTVANIRIAMRSLGHVMQNRGGSALRALRGRLVDADSAAVHGAGGLSGLAGGDAEQWYTNRLAVWADANGTVFSNTKWADEFWGSQAAFMGGADYRFSDKLVVGGSVGFERVAVNFDSGRERDVSYVPLSIYGSYLISDNIAVTALGSYAPGINTTSEVLVVAGDGKADHMSHRFIGGASVTFLDTFDRITTSANGGLMFAHEAFNSFQMDSGVEVDPEDSNLGQLYGSGDVGYLIDAGNDVLVEPFASARLEYDFLQSGGGDSDRFGAVLGGGVRTQVGEDVFLEAFGNTDVARSEETSTSFGLNVRYQF